MSLSITIGFLFFGLLIRHNIYPNIKIYIFRISILFRADLKRIWKIYNKNILPDHVKVLIIQQYVSSIRQF